MRSFWGGFFLPIILIFILLHPILALSFLVCCLAFVALAASGG